MKLSPKQLEKLLKEAVDPFDKVEVNVYTCLDPKNENLQQRRFEVLINDQKRYYSVTTFEVDGECLSDSRIAKKMLGTILYSGLFPEKVAEFFKN